MNDEVTTQQHFIVHRPHVIAFVYAASFGEVSTTDVIVGAPLLLTPRKTLNVFHGPTSVERTAWILYIISGTPAGALSSVISRTPVPPTNSKLPVLPTRRKTLYVVPCAPGGLAHFHFISSAPVAVSDTLMSVGWPGGGTGDGVAGIGS